MGGAVGGKASRAAFGDALLRVGATHPKVVVLDADLAIAQARALDRSGSTFVLEKKKPPVFARAPAAGRA